MTERQLHQAAIDYVETSPANRVPQAKALRPALAGMKMYDPPIMGIASAQDEYLINLQNIPAARINQPPPQFWLEPAKSVVSFFLPFTEQVRKSNRQEKRDVPSQELMHARNEGQAFILGLCAHLKELLEEAGYAAVVPATDPRFWSAAAKPVHDQTFTSNWSERHVAYACGVGTFALHRGIITRLGTAGRFASIITDLLLPPTPRPYSDLEEYCDQCGICAEKCPANAITRKEGKAHLPCREFLEGVEKDYAHLKYIGSCGKCQTGVPCESGIPVRK